MGAYVIRRVLLMLLMLFLVTVAVFILFSLVPTDPARLTCGKACTPEIIEANRERLGLADPLLDAVLGVVQGPVRRAHLRRGHRPSSSPARRLRSGTRSATGSA